MTTAAARSAAAGSLAEMSDSSRPNRRLPNPWIAVPVLIAAAVGWFVGSNVARLSCRPGGCRGEEILWGAVGALVGFAGVLTVSVLVVRSLAEWAALSGDETGEGEGPIEPPGS